MNARVAAEEGAEKVAHITRRNVADDKNLRDGLRNDDYDDITATTSAAAAAVAGR